MSREVQYYLGQEKFNIIYVKKSSIVFMSREVQYINSMLLLFFMGITHFQITD